MNEKKPLRESATKFPPLPFQFLDGIRSSTNKYGRWYAASDIARKMRAQTGQVTRKLLPEEMRTMYTLTDKGHRDLTFISEQAMFGTVFRSSHPWAIEAQAEVLEHLRKTFSPAEEENPARQG